MDDIKAAIEERSTASLRPLARQARRHSQTELQGLAELEVDVGPAEVGAAPASAAAARAPDLAPSDDPATVAFPDDFVGSQSPAAHPVSVAPNATSTKRTDTRFKAGNRGKPRGARHKVTQAVEALLDGEAPALTRKAIELALAGDRATLKLCLDRIAPVRKGRTIKLDVPPLTDSEDAKSAWATLFDAVTSGEVTPEEAAGLAALIEGWQRSHEMAEFDARLRVVEANACR